MGVHERPLIAPAGEMGEPEVVLERRAAPALRLRLRQVRKTWLNA